MKNSQKIEITKFSKDFASGFDFPINGSGWLIVDPLSALLGSIGFPNNVLEIKANNLHPQVLIIVFKDGTKFIPAGEDLKVLDNSLKNYQWL